MTRLTRWLRATATDGLQLIGWAIVTALAGVGLVTVIVWLTGCAAPAPRWVEPVEYGGGGELRLGAMDETAWRMEQGQTTWLSGQ
jgi:hypothetical protein